MFRRKPALRDATVVRDGDKVVLTIEAPTRPDREAMTSLMAEAREFFGPKVEVFFIGGGARIDVIRDGETIEQATANPGEKRDLPRA